MAHMYLYTHTHTHTTTTTRKEKEAVSIKEDKVEISERPWREEREGGKRCCYIVISKEKKREDGENAHLAFDVYTQWYSELQTGNCIRQ